MEMEIWTAYNQRKEILREALGETYGVSSVPLLSTADFEGGLTLCSEGNSDAPMKATYITVNNVRELKAIAGNPDVLFKNGIVKSQEPLISNLSDRNIRAKKDVSGYDDVMLACSTMAAYIYGDSEAV